MEDRLEMRIAVGNHKTAGAQHMRRLAGRRVLRTQDTITHSSGKPYALLDTGWRKINRLDG